MDLIWYAQIGPFKWSKGILVISFWSFQIHITFNSHAYFEDVTPIYLIILWNISNDIKKCSTWTRFGPPKLWDTLGLPISKVRVHLIVNRAPLLHAPSTLPFHLGIVFGFFPCLGNFFGSFPLSCPNLGHEPNLLVLWHAKHLIESII